MIYLDNAATTVQKPSEVAEAMIKALSSFGNPGRGGHGETLRASRAIFETRMRLAAMIGAANASDIAFTANATESLNIGIKGILREGDHVITTALEHNSVLRPLYEMEERGVDITILEPDSSGAVNHSRFSDAVRSNTRAVICTHGSNLTGNMHDIEKIGREAHEAGLIFMVDGSQTVGTFDVDVQKMNIDILCFTGHKSLMGPQGTGGIYVAPGTDVRPLKSGGSGIETYSRKQPQGMPELLEAGTLNGHGIAGLNGALKYIEQEGIENIRRAEINLMRDFYSRVREIEGVTVYGDFTSEIRCPIVSLNIRDHDSSVVSDVLYRKYGISTRPGAHCAPLMHMALGTEKQGAVRFSFGHYNTALDVQKAADAVRDIAAER